MGNFSLDVLAEHVPDWFTGQYTTGVETGTLVGQGAYAMSNVFALVETVEIEPSLYKLASNNLEPVAANVSCHLGHSVAVLEHLIKTIHEPTVFYLDAHWAGNRLVDWSQSDFKGYGVDTGFQRVSTAEQWPSSSQQQVPLIHEVSIICETFMPACVLFINDMDKLDPTTGLGLKNKGFQGEDWTAVNAADLEACWANRLLHIFKGQYQWIVTLQSIPDTLQDDKVHS